MKFFCFDVYSGDPTETKPVGYCAISTAVYVPLKARDMENLRQDIYLFDKNPEILEGCGWVLLGEESKLTKAEYTDILTFNIQKKARKDAQEKR